MTEPLSCAECPTCGTSLPFNKMPFAMRVAFLRKRLGLTQEQLAARVKQDRTTIANIETGRQKITFDTIRPFAAALEVTLEDLIP